MASDSQSCVFGFVHFFSLSIFRVRGNITSSMACLSRRIGILYYPRDFVEIDLCDLRDISGFKHIIQYITGQCMPQRLNCQVSFNKISEE